LTSSDPNRETIPGGTLEEETHAAILIHSADGQVLGLDLDDEAVAAARQRLTGFGDRLVGADRRIHGGCAIVSEIGWQSVDGIVWIWYFRRTSWNLESGPSVFGVTQTRYANGSRSSAGCVSNR